MEWIIDGVGRSRYAFRLVKLSRILPGEDLITIKIPDSTPEIIASHALYDEQALLAIVRYNRLIDIFACTDDLLAAKPLAVHSQQWVTD